MSVVFELCWVVHSAMDVDTSDESSDEKIFRFALEDDDSDFITGICYGNEWKRVNCVVVLREALWAYIESP